MAALPGTVYGGPPWIALEYPVNPHNPATRGALATLRTYHHQISTAFMVRGILEGRIAGRRVTRDVEVVRLGEAGHYAVRGEVPNEGAWVLMLTLVDERGASMGSALAALAPDGSIGRVQVPSDVTADGWSVPREVRADEVAMMIAWSERMAEVVKSGAEASLPSERSRAGLWAILLLPLGLAASRRVWVSKP
jgi:hypothetical protein